MQLLTKPEAKWVKKLQKVLDECPSDRIGFYTIGDPVICLYSREFQDLIEEERDDLVRILRLNGWGFDEVLNFPNAVDGVCG